MIWCLWAFIGVPERWRPVIRLIRVDREMESTRMYEPSYPPSAVAAAAVLLQSTGTMQTQLFQPKTCARGQRRSHPRLHVEQGLSQLTRL